MSDGLIARIKRDLEDTRLIVIDTVQQLLERGERLSDINVRTKVLLEQSERFEARISERQGRVRRGLDSVARGVRRTLRTLWTSTLVVLTRLWVFLFVLFPTHQNITVERYERTTYTTYSHDFYEPEDLDDEEDKKIESRHWIGEYDPGADLKQRWMQRHTPASRQMAQRANQERAKYIDSTCTYMCGAPIFEFGLWPYVPYGVTGFLCVVFLAIYKTYIEAGAVLVVAYLVLGMAFLLILFIIVGLAFETRRHVEGLARRKTRDKKHVIRVEGDEERRGYTVSHDIPESRSGSRSTMRKRGGGVDMNAHNGSSVSSIMTSSYPGDFPVGGGGPSRMMRALHRADGGTREGEEVHIPMPVDELSENGGVMEGESRRDHDDEFDMKYANAPSLMENKTVRGIVRAIESKLMEASVMMGLVFLWMVYGVLFSFASIDKKNETEMISTIVVEELFPFGVGLGLAVGAFILTQTSYISSCFDVISVRYGIFALWVLCLSLVPTGYGNVPSSSMISVFSLETRMFLFFIVYGMAEMQTTTEINYWMRFCNRKNLMRNLPKAVTPPIGQIDTPGQRRLYAMQKIVFQSAYVLFVPWLAWPFALLHIIWLGYRIQSAVRENNEGLMKKYEDLSINPTGLLDLPPGVPENDLERGPKGFQQSVHNEEQGTRGIQGMAIKGRGAPHVQPPIYDNVHPRHTTIHSMAQPHTTPVPSEPFARVFPEQRERVAEVQTPPQFTNGGEMPRHEVDPVELHLPPPGVVHPPNTLPPPMMMHTERPSYRAPSQPGYPSERYPQGVPPSYRHPPSRFMGPSPSFRYRESPRRAYPPHQYRGGGGRGVGRGPSSYPGRSPVHSSPSFRGPRGHRSSQPPSYHHGPQHPPPGPPVYREMPLEPVYHGGEELSPSPLSSMSMEEERGGTSDREEYPVTLGE